MPFGRLAAVSPPPLSVIMPVHNGIPFVEDAVRSILRQSFADFEFVIGDDGCSDGTTDVLRRLADEDARIRLLRRERPSGLAASANWLVGETRAPLVAVMHADDLARPERLARQMAVLEQAPELQLVGTLWHGVDETGRPVRPPDYWRVLRNSPFAAFSHSSIMMRYAAFERAGGYRPEAEYWEDLDLYYRIADLGAIAVIPEVLSIVRHAQISTRLRDAQERVESAVDLMFRAVAAREAGGDADQVIGAGPRDGPLEPMTFVSCGSTNLWSGRSPQVFRRLRERARLRFDGRSLHALIWVLWGTASPRSLRLVLRGILHMRNAIAKPLLRSRQYVLWLVPRADASELAVIQACCRAAATVDDAVTSSPSKTS